MQYPAHAQAAIEILKELEANERPVDRIIAYYFKTRRYIGSKDKKAIAEAVYGVLRQQGLIDWALTQLDVPLKPRPRVAAWVLLETEHKDLRYVFTGEKYAPQKLWRTEKAVMDVVKVVNKNKKNMPLAARFNYPGWLEGSLQKAYGSSLAKAMAALGEKAQADIRTNTLKTTPAALTKALEAEGYGVAPAPYAPNGLRLDDPKNLFQLGVFKAGLFEMQDAGSQLIAALCGVGKKQKVTDFCAGAGGKTLALAAMMGNSGILTAGDIIPQKLEELKKRLKRAGVDNTHLRQWSSEADAWVKRQKGTQDVVLLDVPCSGSGVWRRNPDAKWSLTQERLDELCAIQQRILQSAQRLVKTGGRLIYATCSILPEENEHQIERFVSEHKAFKIIPIQTLWQPLAAKGVVSGVCPELKAKTLRLAPHTTRTDGFFIAILEKQAE